MYLSWAGFFEGSSDRQYYPTLIFKVIEDLVLKFGERKITVPEDCFFLGEKDRSHEAVAREACENLIHFHIWFIHADTGGRGVEAQLDQRSGALARLANEICGFSLIRSVILAPRKETESWILADKNALLRAMGLNENYNSEILPISPEACERLRDPKMTLNEFARSVDARRYSGGTVQLFQRIANIQDLNVLRRLESFRDFEDRLKLALLDLRCIRAM